MTADKPDEEASPASHVETVGGDSGPVSPSELEESAFLATQADQEQPAVAVTPAPVKNAAAEPSTSLPPLEDLVQRIPPLTRELLETLFRAKFVTVKRLPESAFKT